MLPTVLAFLSAEHLALILLVVIFFFGATKIPELARSIGRAKGEFEKGAYESRMELDARKKGAVDSKSVEDVEAEKIRAAALALGIPTEGRSLADIKADLRAKTA